MYRRSCHKKVEYTGDFRCQPQESRSRTRETKALLLPSVSSEPCDEEAQFSIMPIGMGEMFSFPSKVTEGEFGAKKQHHSWITSFLHASVCSAA
jgi:hypothetical protein